MELTIQTFAMFDLRTDKKKKDGTSKGQLFS